MFHFPSWVTCHLVFLFLGIDVKTGLVVDPRTKALVLNGEPGHLQFYSLQSDQQLFSVSWMGLY